MEIGSGGDHYGRGGDDGAKFFGGCTSGEKISGVLHVIIIEVWQLHDADGLGLAVELGGDELDVIAARLIWVFPGAYLSRVLTRCPKEEQAPSAKGLLILGWTGLRGVVSLAAALSLPLETNSGLPFPYRSLILFLTFVVILVTLLLQGFTLRPLIRWLGIEADKSSEEETLLARIHTTERALGRLSELEDESPIPGNVMPRVRGYFEDRLSGLREQLSQETGTDVQENPAEFRTLAEQRMWWELARVEREAVLALRAQQKIGDEGLREIEREIDLLEARLVPRGR